MWVRAQLCKLQKGCSRLAAASDKVYQLLAHGRRFSPGTPAFSTTKTGPHDIAEILLKVALKHQKSINLTHYSDSRPTSICSYSLMAACWAEEQQISFFIVFCFAWPSLEPMIYYTDVLMCVSGVCRLIYMLYLSKRYILLQWIVTRHNLADSVPP